MDGDLERRVEALEESQRETKGTLDRLLEHSFATDAKLAEIDAKLDAKASAADVAKLDAKVDLLVKAVGDLVIDIRMLRDNARTDYRVLFGAIITVALGLAALVAKSLHWV